jgi:Right handed beta helix region
MRLLILIIGLALYATHLTAQTRYYVHATATGTNDGSSWANAFTDLQSALVLADAGDSVWVAEGLYKPTSSNVPNISFEPRSGVVLLGGFAGTEGDITQRDWAAHTTTLSGDIGVQGDSLDNSYNVIYLHEPDSSTVVDGFLIQHGYAVFLGSAVPTDRLRSGGGIYIQGKNAEAYATVRNCTFRYNRSFYFGGAIAIMGLDLGSVAPTIENCVFEYNSSNYGGAIARFGSSWVDRPDFVNCIFRYNLGYTDCGGIYFQDAERTDRLDIEGCEFFRNTSQRFSPALCLFADRTTGASVNVSGCSFVENMANIPTSFQSEYVPAMMMVGSTYFLLKDLTIENCRFENNNRVSDRNISRDIYTEYFEPNISVKFERNTFLNESEFINQDLYIQSTSVITGISSIVKTEWF